MMTETVLYVFHYTPGHYLDNAQQAILDNSPGVWKTPVQLILLLNTGPGIQQLRLAMHNATALKALHSAFGVIQYEHLFTTHILAFVKLSDTSNASPLLYCLLCYMVTHKPLRLYNTAGTRMAQLDNIPSQNIQNLSHYFDLLIYSKWSVLKIFFVSSLPYRNSGALFRKCIWQQDNVCTMPQGIKQTPQDPMLGRISSHIALSLCISIIHRYLQ